MADLSQHSANAANAQITLTATPAQGQTAFLDGFTIYVAGATAGSIKQATISGLLSGTMTITMNIQASALALTSFTFSFSQPLPASAPGTPLVLTVPAVGAGSTNASASLLAHSAPL